MKQLDVVNFALSMLGRHPVTALDDEEVGGVVMAMWPSAVEYVVEEVKPLWAKRASVLRGEADGRLPGFVWSGVLPDGCMGVVDVKGAGWCVFDGRLFWTREAEEVSVVWLERPDDAVHEWVCADGELLAAKLACLCAFPVTGSRDLAVELAVEVSRLERRAQYRARLQDMGRGGRDRVVSQWGREGVV